MATANELLLEACASGVSCLGEMDLLRIIAQGASAGGPGGGGGGGTLSTDGTFAANSDLLYPSQKAAKTYINTNIAAALVTADGLYVKKAGDTMTGALILPAGSAAAPSLGVGGTTSGLLRPAANQLAISTAGVQRMVVDASGNVGIGTTTPSLVGFSGSASGLQIAGVLPVLALSDTSGTLGSTYLGQVNTDAYLTNSAAGKFFFGTSDAVRMTIDASGNVGIGITAPLAKLHVTPAASGTDYFRIDHSDGTPRVQVGALTGSVTLGALWFGNIVPSATNYGLASDGTSLRVGSPIAIPSGSNQRAGNATLVGGTLTVLNTTVTANTLIFLTRKTTGGTIGFAVTYTVIAATSFTITSDNVLDTSTYSYLLVENP